MVACLDGETGIPVARYPEWDYLISADRTDGTVVEVNCPTGPSVSIEQLEERYREVVNRLAVPLPKYRDRIFGAR
jgi:hypothetical protein